MPEPQAFHGSTRTVRPRDRRLAGLASALLVAFLALAVAKPWAAQLPDASPAPEPSLATAPPPSLQTTGPQVVALEAAPSPGPLPVAFTSARPPAPSTAWRALRWRRLASDDPRSLLTTIVRWRGGYLAVGRQDGMPATPVWTSTDGTRWTPVQFGTPTTFWAGLNVLAVAERPGGLVAVTEARAWCTAPCDGPYVLPVMSWTSSDGRQWTQHILPPEWLAQPEGVAPLVAAGPAGLVVATTGAGARLAISPDGITWSSAATSLPEAFALDDLVGTSSGYVAAGRWQMEGVPAEAATLWSADGRRWSLAPTLIPASPDLGTAGRTTLLTAVDGLIAVAEGGTVPGGPRWWQSSDGLRWRPLEGYPPLGTWSSSGAAIRSGPHGSLVGDGRRLLAMRTGTSAVAWTSSDGLAWTALAMLGDIPPEAATAIVLLPGGVLLSDGSSTWLGEAATS